MQFTFTRLNGYKLLQRTTRMIALTEQGASFCGIDLHSIASVTAVSLVKPFSIKPTFSTIRCDECNWKLAAAWRV